MQLSDFHYNIPQELIASQPPAERGEARLLALDRATGKIADRTYGDIVDYLQSGDVLVINDTKVIKARLITHKSNGGGVRELVLVEKHGPADDWHRHRVIYRRRLKAGDELKIGNNTINVEEILSDGIAVVRAERDLLAIAEEHGSVPLPPYMQREATATDSERYQTVFAREAGSVAAPTASLNMTEATLQKLRQKGVKIAYATLHVGLGTFLPIRVKDVTLHKMHQEYYEIPSETVRLLRESQVRGNRIVALGTTITRTLEYAHDDIFEGDIRDLCGEADIFIYPGYQFKTIQGLITNFHMPESTVLMLTAAFAGWDKLRPAYEHAVAKRYNFFSYGDSMVIL